MINRLRNNLNWFLILAIILTAVVITIPYMSMEGDYAYEIYMIDGTIVRAWEVHTENGVMYIKPPRGQGDTYYLSPTQYKKIVYVGHKHVK